MTCMCDYRRGSGLNIGFIDRFTARLETTSNYSAIAKVHTLQITTAFAKTSPACCMFTSLLLAAASDRGDSSASSLTSLIVVLHSKPTLATANSHLTLN